MLVLTVSGSVTGQQRSIVRSEATAREVTRAFDGAGERTARPHHLRLGDFRYHRVQHNLGKSATPQDSVEHHNFSAAAHLVLPGWLASRGHGPEVSVGYLDTIVERVLLAAPTKIDNDAA